jgi:hypothetical protein
VQGDVEWLVNKTGTGWAVTLMNPAGQDKPQHGITPTDYRKNRTVTIRGRVPFKSARDRLLPDDALRVVNDSASSALTQGSTVPFVSEVRVEVPAGSVKIIELK